VWVAFGVDDIHAIQYNQKTPNPDSEVRKLIDRQHAWSILNEHTQSPNLIKHALAGEAAMRWYARYYQDDEDKWAMVGLLHDFDYERWPSPEDHPLKGAAILAERGYSEEIIHAIKTHTPYLGIPRRTQLEKTLFAVDELCGFVTAVTLVRPSKSIQDVGPDSVIRKMKDKRFAASVSRDDIRQGAAELPLDLKEHVANVILAMQSVASDLGL
jgi:putative nucleotidyltransferase with HDIG domain